jgi:hypothetical protein
VCPGHDDLLLLADMAVGHLSYFLASLPVLTSLVSIRWLHAIFSHVVSNSQKTTSLKAY